MNIEGVIYHLEFYTVAGELVEDYRMPGPFVLARPGERVHLHKGSFTMDVAHVVHDLVEHEGSRLVYTVKIFGDEVPGAE